MSARRGRISCHTICIQPPGVRSRRPVPRQRVELLLPLNRAPTHNSTAILSLRPPTAASPRSAQVIWGQAMAVVAEDGGVSGVAAFEGHNQVAVGMEQLAGELTEIPLHKRFHPLGRVIHPVKAVIAFEQSQQAVAECLARQAPERALLGHVAFAVERCQIQEIDVVVRKYQRVAVEKPVLEMEYAVFQARLAVQVDVMRPQRGRGVGIGCARAVAGYLSRDEEVRADCVSLGHGIAVRQIPHRAFFVIGAVAEPDFKRALYNVAGVGVLFVDRFAVDPRPEPVIFAVGDMIHQCVGAHKRRPAVYVVDALAVGLLAESGWHAFAEQTVDHRLEHNVEVTGHKPLTGQPRRIQALGPAEERMAEVPQLKRLVTEILVFYLTQTFCAVTGKIMAERGRAYRLVMPLGLDPETVLPPHMVKNRVVDHKQLLVEVNLFPAVHRFGVNGRAPPHQRRAPGHRAAPVNTVMPAVQVPDLEQHEVAVHTGETYQRQDDVDQRGIFRARRAAGIHALVATHNGGVVVAAEHAHGPVDPHRQFIQEPAVGTINAGAVPVEQRVRMITPEHQAAPRVISRPLRLGCQHHLREEKHAVVYRRIKAVTHVRHTDLTLFVGEIRHTGRHDFTETPSVIRVAFNHYSHQPRQCQRVQPGRNQMPQALRMRQPAPRPHPDCA